MVVNKQIALWALPTGDVAGSAASDRSHHTVLDFATTSRGCPANGSPSSGFAFGPLVNQLESPLAPSPFCEGAFFTGVNVLPRAPLLL